MAEQQQQKQQEQKASVGRIVHYVPAGPTGKDGAPLAQCRAALVTDVTEDVVRLTVFLPRSTVIYPTGTLYLDATYDAEKAPSTWHWPERA